MGIHGVARRCKASQKVHGRKRLSELAQGRYYLARTVARIRRGEGRSRGSTDGQSARSCSAIEYKGLQARQPYEALIARHYTTVSDHAIGGAV